MNIKSYDDGIFPIKIFLHRSLSKLPCVKSTVVFNLPKNIFQNSFNLGSPFTLYHFCHGLEIGRSCLIENPNLVIPPMLGIADLSRRKSELLSNFKDSSVQINIKRYILNLILPKNDYWGLLYSSYHKAIYLSSVLFL